MSRNIFFPALTELQREELQTVRQAADYNFHGLLDVERLVESPDIDFDELLDAIRKELIAFDGSVDAIIAHWDFPTSVLVPVICRELGLPSPSVESVLKCEHKYWSRREQEKSVPDMVPKYCSFDPFDDDALKKIDMDFPFWIKPVKSFNSQLGYKISSAAEFREAMEEVRDEIGHMGKPFEQALAHADVPDDVRRATSYTCVAECIISGEQCAAEGSVFNGEVEVHGILDMGRDDQARTINSLEYPSVLPDHVQQQMIDCCKRFLTHIGFDNGCYNAEFMWNREQDQLCLIEFNTRISQSHAELFIDVDGISNHEVAIDVALGIRPELPYRQGKSKVAGKFVISLFEEDALVTKVPTKAQIDDLKSRFPGLDVLIDVKPGMRLSELRNQDSYSYHVGTLFLGASSREELNERYRTCLEVLEFGYEPIDPEITESELAQLAERRRSRPPRPAPSPR